MTDDQQFIVAILTLIVPTAVSILTYRKTSETHTIVNGIQVKALRRARAQGVAQGSRARKVKQPETSSLPDAPGPLETSSSS